MTLVSWVREVHGCYPDIGLCVMLVNRILRLPFTITLVAIFGSSCFVLNYINSLPHVPLVKLTDPYLVLGTYDWNHMFIGSTTYFYGQMRVYDYVHHQFQVLSHNTVINNL